MRSVTRVGESISASAADRHRGRADAAGWPASPFYSDLAWPFAIAVVVILLAGLSLLPALLSIRLSLLAVKRTLFRAMFGRPSCCRGASRARGGIGVWGRVAGRIVQHPGADADRRRGVLRRPGLRRARLHRGRLRRQHQPARRQRLGGGHGAADQALPAVGREPDHADLQVQPRRSAPIPAPLAKATSELRASSLFTQVTGPLNPVGGITLHARAVRRAVRRARPGQQAACHAAGCRALDHGRIPRAGLPAVPGHRELRQPRRQDGAVLRPG